MIEFENNNINLNDDYVGVVMDIDREKRTCYVFIPKLMMGLPDSTIINNEYPVEDINIINKTELNIAKSLTKTNILKVYAEDLDEPMPSIGSLVLVYFLEGNPKYGYWEKFNPNGKYEIIEEERYPKSFTIQLNNKTIDVNQDDIIQINIPEDYDITVIESNKTKQINILENKELKTSLYNLKQYVQALQDNVSFIVKNQKSESIAKLNTSYSTLDAEYSDKTLINNMLNYILKQINYISYNELSLEDIVSVTTDIDDKIKSLKDLINAYTNYVTKYETVWSSEYGLLTTNDAKKEITERYNNLLENNYDLIKSEIDNILEKLNTQRTISVYFEDIELQSKTKDIGDDFYLPNNKKLVDAYLIKYPSATTSDIVYNITNSEGVQQNNIDIIREASIANGSIDYNEHYSSIGCISIHDNPKLSKENQITVSKYIKSQDIYLNLVNLDFDIILIPSDEEPTNPTNYMMAVIDSTEYHTNITNQNKVTLEDISLSVTKKTGSTTTELVATAATGEIDDENMNGWVITNSQLNDDIFDDEDALIEQSYITINSSDEITIEMSVSNEFKRIKKINSNNIESYITDDLETDE